MTTDRAGAPSGAPWSELTYRGFSAPSGTADLDPPPAAGRRPVPRRVIVGGGLVAAVALGLLGGFWVRPDLGHPKPAAPMRAVTPAAEDGVPAGQTLAIEVGKPVSPPAAQPQPRPSGKLEVLPAGMARAAASPALTAAAPTPTAPPPRVVVADPSPPPGSGLRFAVPAVPAPHVNAPPLVAPPLPAPTPTQQRFAAASGPCANAATRAAQMVCADPELAAADRAMVRAYRRALNSGAPPEALSRDQRAWFAAREEAARRSPRAVADLYDRRIDELNAAVEDDDGPS